jgi:uncharacterized membrane protein
MTENPNNLQSLESRLENLSKQQTAFLQEITQLREEIRQLKAGGATVKTPVAQPPSVQHVPAQPTPEQRQPTPAQKPANIPPKPAIDWEKFIGENLISKIGIIILVLGVAVGAKYSIENNLINPLTRIVLGYVTGLVLLALAFRLKAKHENYSAVLLSGSMAIMYFITFFGYNLYGLIPQTLAFALMTVFTAFTVLASLKYNQQVIAHIGLVGAYAVPFLLGDDSGKVVIMFSYIALINLGILFISFRRDWQGLYYNAFALTWVIYFFWFLFGFDVDKHLVISLVFPVLFFLSFYTVFLAYKWGQKEQFQQADIFVLLANSFIFYGFGYAALNRHDTAEQFLGLFTGLNALLHFVVGTLMYRRSGVDRNVIHLVVGLALAFATMAVPVQLDGNWVTLLWTSEALLLFWIGRSRQVSVYEQLSYGLMVLAFVSLLDDWSDAYGQYLQTSFHILFNIHFLTSILFVTGFALINFLDRTRPHDPHAKSAGLYPLMQVVMPSILLIGLYFTFSLELSEYWQQKWNHSAITISEGDYSYPTYNEDFLTFKDVWTLNYTLVFFSLVALVNALWFRAKSMGTIASALILISTLLFLITGMHSLGTLRTSYLQGGSEYFNVGLMHLMIRYISFGILAFGFFSIFQNVKREILAREFAPLVSIAMHVSVLAVLSYELIHWLLMYDITNTNKLALSILWGAYALTLIVLGIARRIRYLRILAMVFFGITLVKVFVYDIAHLGTLSKVVVFVSLGVLLLVASFLYNKFTIAENETK